MDCFYIMNKKKYWRQAPPCPSRYSNVIRHFCTRNVTIPLLNYNYHVTVKISELRFISKALQYKQAIYYFLVNINSHSSQILVDVWFIHNADNDCMQLDVTTVISTIFLLVNEHPELFIHNIRSKQALYFAPSHKTKIKPNFIKIAKSSPLPEKLFRLIYF